LLLIVRESKTLVKLHAKLFLLLLLFIFRKSVNCIFHTPHPLVSLVLIVVVTFSLSLSHPKIERKGEDDEKFTTILSGGTGCDE
jgi:hypothetical protein